MRYPAFFWCGMAQGSKPAGAPPCMCGRRWSWLVHQVHVLVHQVQANRMLLACTTTRATAAGCVQSAAATEQEWQAQ
jgi:hypothetical protein